MGQNTEKGKRIAPGKHKQFPNFRMTESFTFFKEHKRKVQLLIYCSVDLLDQRTISKKILINLPRVQHEDNNVLGLSACMLAGETASKNTKAPGQGPEAAADPSTLLYIGAAASPLEKCKVIITILLLELGGITY